MEAKDMNRKECLHLERVQLKLEARRAGAFLQPCHLGPQDRRIKSSRSFLLQIKFSASVVYLRQANKKLLIYIKKIAH